VGGELEGENVKLNHLAAVSAAAVLAAGSAQALVIDTFDTEHTVEDVPTAGESVADEIFAPEALGDYRHLYVQNKQGISGGTTLDVRAGQLEFSNNVDASGTGTITYDGPGGFDPIGGDPVNTSGLGGIDFLIGPVPFLEFDVSSFEQDLFVQIDAWDLSGNQTRYTETLPPAGLFSPLLPLDDFEPLGTEFDWTQVGALQFFVESFVSDADPDGGYDGSISGIELNAIPLPASAFLVLGGLGGLTLLRARRRQG
jgi:hypothetical protein